MELSLENRLICCGIEEGLADIIEAGLDHTVVLLLEMESDSVSDESVYKLWVEFENGVARTIETTDINVVVCGGSEKSNGRKD